MKNSLEEIKLNSYRIKLELNKTVEVIEYLSKSIKHNQNKIMEAIRNIQIIMAGLSFFSFYNLSTRLKLSETFIHIRNILKKLDDFDEKTKDKIIQTLDGMETIKIDQTLFSSKSTDIYVFFDKTDSRIIFYDHRFEDDERYEIICKL